MQEYIYSFNPELIFDIFNKIISKIFGMNSSKLIHLFA